jgi:hypothetical protein
MVPVTANQPIFIDVGNKIPSQVDEGGSRNPDISRSQIPDISSQIM